MSEKFEALSQAIIDGEKETAVTIVKELIDAGEPVKNILDNALVKGMDVVGDLFRNNEYFIPEVLVSARAMSACMELVEPLLASGAGGFTGKALVGTVKGDLHDIGKNIVIAMMKGAGFQVIDLGTDVDAGRFASEVASHKPDILGLSALLTTTMPAMKDTIATLEKQGLRDSVKVIVGGAPLSEKFAAEIGADAFGRDAAESVIKAKELLGV